ncbi:MAG: HNH endonuclease [Bdellovibrionaceae bacterium]|nr:HNH endonuclease [Bdellovibrio sp.]
MLKWILGLVYFVSIDVSATRLGTELGPELEMALKGQDQFEYSQYFVVKEELRSASLNLLNLKLINEKFPLPSDPYQREPQFGGWIFRDERKCINTRAEVLERDSKSNVTYRPNGCTILNGQWDDVYSGQEFSSAEEIQIDHFVPLKNAYMSGAFEWNYKKRCLYANYLGNNFHLLAVSGKENMHKSDHAPNEYVPPNKKYTCEYLKHWLQVKLIWSLRLTPVEVDAIKQKAAEAQCGGNAFIISQQDLDEQRRFMVDHANLCNSHQ